MDETMGNEGINKLAGVFQSRMKGISEKPVVLDFGSINGDMSLTTNAFPQPIPKSDYMVCRQLTIGKKGDELTNLRGTEQKDVMIPETMRKLKAGDRVLVAWVGDDACIIDIILSGNSL